MTGMDLFLCGIVGLATSIAFVYITQYYTAGTYRPVRDAQPVGEQREAAEQAGRASGRPYWVYSATP